MKIFLISTFAFGDVFEKGVNIWRLGGNYSLDYSLLEYVFGRTVFIRILTHVNTTCSYLSLLPW